MACRRNEQGVWKGEVYTKRDFEAHEILLAPHSSQLKDSHLMALTNAPVTLPRTGRGAHPENTGLALDGRCRTLIASEGALDEKEYTGSLYWLVTRTGDPAEANLQVENVTFKQNIEVVISGHKKRKLAPVEWDPSEMPSLPILTNKKAIEKHTKLCMFAKEARKNTK